MNIIVFRFSNNFMIRISITFLMNLLILSCYGQDIGWLKGIWNGRGETPGSQYTTHFVRQLKIDTVFGNYFVGELSNSVADNKGTAVRYEIVGSLKNSAINIIAGRLLYKKEPPSGYWENCSSCKEIVTTISVNGDNIILKSTVSNCKAACDGTTNYFRSLYTFDTVTQKRIINQLGTESEKKFFNPFVNGKTPLSNNSFNLINEKKLIHDTIKIHDTVNVAKIIKIHDTIFIKNSFPKPIITNTIAEALQSRRNVVIRSYHVNDPEIKIELFDNAEIDGDSVTVYDNNEIIIEKEMLNETAIVRYVKADAQNRNHSFTLVALNLGTIPPNTALMRITSGSQRFEITAKSDLTQNAIVEVIYDGQ